MTTCRFTIFRRGRIGSADLDNYIDTRHYSGAINDAMAEAMAAGENRITDAARSRLTTT